MAIEDVVVVTVASNRRPTFDAFTVQKRCPQGPSAQFDWPDLQPRGKLNASSKKAAHD